MLKSVISILFLNVARELQTVYTFLYFEVPYVYDVVIKKFTFAISFTDEFLVIIRLQRI